MSEIRTFSISLPYATVGIRLKNSIVIDAAPIFGWMKGKHIDDIKPWLINKKAIVVEICISQ